MRRLIFFPLSSLLALACAAPKASAPPAGSSERAAAPTPPAAPAPDPAKEAAAKKAAELEAARAGLAEARSAITPPMFEIADEKPTAEAFDRARGTQAALAKAIDRAEAAGAEPLAQDLAGARAELEKNRAELEARWAVVGLEIQRTQVDEGARSTGALVKATARKEATAEDFQKAATATVTLAATLENGRVLEAKDPKYAQLAAQKRKELEALSKSLGDNQRRAAIDAQRGRVEAARAGAKTAQAAAAGADPAAIDAFAQAVGALEAELEKGKGLADKAYQAWAAVPAREVTAHRQTIERLRLKAELVAHKKKADEAAAKVDQALAADGGPAQAEQAMSELESVLKEGEPLGAKDKAYAAQLAALNKRLAAQRALALAKKGDARAVEVKAGLDKARAAAEEKIALLPGKLEHELYQAAEDGVSEWARVVSEAEGAAAELPKLQPLVKAEQAALLAKRTLIRRTRVEAAKAALEEKKKALEGSPEPAAYAAVEEALRVLANTVEGAKSLSTPDKTYQQLLAQTEAALPRERDALEKRRARQEIDQHKQQVEARAQALAQALAALEGEPPEAAFGAAESAAGELGSALDLAEGSAAKDPGHQAYLAAKKKSVDAARAQIERRKVQAAVARHKKAAGEAWAALAEKEQGLAGQPEDPAFQVADEALAQVNRVLEGVEDVALGDAAYAKELNGAKARAAAARGRLDKRKGEVLAVRHKQKVAEAQGALAAARASADEHEKALEALEQALEEGKALAASDPRHAAFLAAEEKKLPAERALLAKKKTGDKVQAHKAELAKALAKVEEAMTALAGKLEQPLYLAAEDAVAAAQKQVDAAESLAEEDAAYARELKAHTAALRARRMDMRRVRAEAAAAVVGERMKALDGAPDEDAFEAARDALRVLGSTVEAAKAFEAKEPAYVQKVAALEKQVAAGQAALEKRKTSLAVGKHRAQVDAALAAASAALKEMAAGADPALIGKAEAAVGELERSFETEDSVAAEDKAHQAFLAGERKKVAGYRAQLARRGVELEVSGARAKLGAAQASLQEKLKALGAQSADADFAAAEEAAGALEAAAGEAGGAAEKDPRFAKEVAQAKGRLPAARAAIQARRAANALAVHAAKIDEAEKEAQAKLGALGGEDAAQQAEAALEALGKLLEEGAALPGRDKKLQARWAGLQQKLPAQAALIARDRAKKEIAAFDEKLKEAEALVAERMAALEGKLEQSLYQAAVEAVDKLKKAADAGQELVEKDPAFAKRLAAVGARVEEHRVGIRKKRIEAAQAVLEERMKVLAGTPKEEDFSAADRALRDYGNTVEAGRTNTESKPYLAFVAQAEKRLETYRARIEQRRTSVVVEAHKKELDQAALAVEKAMAALKGKVEESDFEEADKALSALKDVLGGGGEAAEKDQAYARRMAALDESIGKHRETIEKRRLDLELEAHRREVQEAARAANERLAALGAQPEQAAFTAAEEGIGKLESAIEEGQSLADKNQAYEKELAGQKAKVDGLKARLAKRRIEVDASEHARAIEAAAAAADQAAQALKGAPKPEAFEEAEQAVGELEKALESGGELARLEPKLGRRSAELKKGLGKRRAAIGAAKAELELAEHRGQVEAAAAEVEKRLAALDGEISPSNLKGVENAIESLEEALKNGRPLGKKSAKHGQWLASFGGRVAKFQNTLGRKAVAREVQSHREELKTAEENLREKIKAAEGKLEQPPYQEAESAVAELKKIADEGAELAAKDPAYGKELAKSRALADGERVRMRKSWIGAAQAQAAEKVGALTAKAGPSDFREAESAVRVLENTADSGRSLKTKDKSYAAFVAAALKDAKLKKALIEKRRSESEFADVRAELDAAASDASKKVAEAGPGAGPEEVEAALEAVSSLERVIEANGPAAEKDKAHAKRLAALKKRAAKDKVRLEKLRATAELAPLKAKLAEAEAQLTSRMAALKGGDAEAVSGVEEAISGAESALEEGQALEKSKEGKARAAKLKKKLALARAAVKAKQGEAGAAEAKKELADAVTAAKEAVSGLGKSPDRVALSEAERSVDRLGSTISELAQGPGGKKKLAKSLAAAKKSHKQLLAELKKAGQGGGAEGAEVVAKLSSAQKELKAAMKALVAKPKDETSLANARAAADALESAAEDAAAEAQGKKPLLAKLAKAKVQLQASKKKLSKLEAVAAKAQKKKALAQVEEEPPAGDEEEEVGPDPQARVAEAWASLSKQLKAMKKKKKASPEALESATQAADEVEQALADGARSTAGKQPKFKKYAKTIRAKLARARATLKKRRAAL